VRAAGERIDSEGHPKGRAVYRLLLALTVVTVTVPFALGIETQHSGAPPLSAGSADAAYARILAAHVRGGGVDYDGLRAELYTLERIVATWARVGPRTAPARYKTSAARLAYYLNAYNAFVLYGVLRHTGIRSVRDVHGPFEPAAGMGFFWAQWFELDGRTVSLHELENGVIRARFKDARVHAALNCASASCPALSSIPFRAGRVNAQLDERAAVLASEPPHVVVDHGSRELRLSQIYTWYEDDFVRDARRAGGHDIVDWMVAHSSEVMRPTLERARRERYTLRFVPYDWRLNDAPDATLSVVK
jgi:hypothetical protein